MIMKRLGVIIRNAAGPQEKLGHAVVGHAYAEQQVRWGVLDWNCFHQAINSNYRWVRVESTIWNC